MLSRLCTSSCVRLLCNRASVSLVLCNKSIFVDSTFWLTLGCTLTYLFARVFPCTLYAWSTCLHCILRIFSNIIEAHLQLHQILCHHPNQAPPKAFTCVGVRTDKNWYQQCYFIVHIWVNLIHFQHRSKVHWYSFFSFYHSHFA